MGEGSKRARRDSSSSLGSSLSMEMPPLFSNGVVGQTTSHLVSRYLPKDFFIFHCSTQGDRLVPWFPALAKPVFVWTFSPPSPSFPATLINVASVPGENKSLIVSHTHLFPTIALFLINLFQTLSQSVITAHAQSQTSQQPRRNISGSTRTPGGGGGPDRCHSNHLFQPSIFQLFNRC